MDLSAKIMFGYPLPDHEYEDFDPDQIWFDLYAPEEVKQLDLSEEERDAWNALPYHVVGFGPDPHTADERLAADAFSSRLDVFLDARFAWEKKNPCPVKVEHCGHGDDLQSFLTAKGPNSDKLKAEADWRAEPLNLLPFDTHMDQQEAERIQEVLDGFCAATGLDPEGAEVGFYLAPLYW